MTAIATRPLRVAMMLESDGPGGAEMMVFRLSEELRRRGHTVVPVGPERGIGWLGGLFRDAGFSTEVFRLRRTIDPGCVRGLAQLFREHRIDVVHSHEFTMAVYGRAASMVVGIPQIVTMHGGLTVWKALRRRIALRWAMRGSASTVVVSRATQAQYSASFGVPERTFTVVPNGVPVAVGDASRVRAEFSLRDDELVILAVGTLEKHKGHRVLIDALAQLQREGLTVPWRLIIAGGRGGDQHESLLEQVRQHGLGDRIHIVTGRNDIPDLQAAAHIFAMPSIWEGLPLALLEGMVAGNAVVASATAGIPEAVTHGRDGLLVPPGEVAPLADALRTLLTDTRRREELAAAAAARAHQEFTVQVMAQRYEELYLRALGAGRAPRSIAS